MRRQDPSQIPGRHDPDGDWPGVGATAGHLVWPPRALGRVVLFPLIVRVGPPRRSLAAEVVAPMPPPPPVNLGQGHGDLVFSMDSFDAITIHPKNEGI